MAARAHSSAPNLVSLRRRFVWLLTGVVALFAAGMTLSLVFSVRANDAALDQLRQAEARQAGANISRRWGYYGELVSNMARDPELIDVMLVGTDADRERWAASRQRLIPGILGLALIGPKGEVYGDVESLRVGPECISDLRARSDWHSGPANVHRTTPGLEHVDFVATVRGPAGETLGNVFLSVRTSQLQRIIRDSTQAGHAISLLDSRGETVASSGSLRGEMRETRVDLPAMGWSLRVQSPVQYVSYAGLLQVLAGMLTLLGVIVLLIVAAMRLRKPIANEIHAALEALACLTRKEPAPIVETRYAEFAPAISAINGIARQLGEQREQLARLSLTDPLTGLPNRRAFENQFPHMLGLADRGHATALVLLDLDYFKSINDELGHAAGDRALIALANTLKALSRKADLAARLAGDEFTIMLTDIDNDGIRACYQRLADHFRSELRAAGLTGDSTISAGQTWLHAKAGDSLAKAMARADYALYQAKARGRGQLVLEGDIERNAAG